MSPADEQNTPALSGDGPWPAGSGLHLPLHPSTALVTLDLVRAVSGLDTERVWTRVESGRLRWVWDISARSHPGGAACRGEVRELRFWAAELVAPEHCRYLQVEQVLSTVLGGQRQHWTSIEVAQRWLCSRAILKRLVDAGELAGPLRARTRWLTRASMADFLRRRLVGWATGQAPSTHQQACPAPAVAPDKGVTVGAVPCQD
jgi:hypothetical protein